MLRRFGLLALNESLVCSSSSSRVPVQRRPHAILSSQVSAQRRPHWQTLHLDEAVSLDTVAPAAVNRRAERTNMTWRSLDLDDCDDLPDSKAASGRLCPWMTDAWLGLMCGSVHWSDGSRSEEESTLKHMPHQSTHQDCSLGSCSPSEWYNTGSKSET